MFGLTLSSSVASVCHKCDVEGGLQLNIKPEEEIKNVKDIFKRRG